MTKELALKALESYLGKTCQESHLQEVTGGYSFVQHYLYRTADHNLFLKVFKHKPAERFHEQDIRAHTKAERLGIAPKLFYLDSVHRVWLLEAIQGRHLSFSEYQTDIYLQKIFKTLRILHTEPVNDLPIALTSWDYCKKLLSFMKHLDVNETPIKKLLLSMPLLEKKADVYQSPIQFIHNDLNPHNIIITHEHCLFVDWNAAGRGCIFQDLAEIMVFLPIESHVSTLGQYYGRQPTPEEIALNHYHYAMRLGLFAIWGLAMLDQLYPEDLSIKMWDKYKIISDQQGLLLLFQDLLQEGVRLNSKEDFLRFTVASYNAFLENERSICGEGP